MKKQVNLRVGLYRVCEIPTWNKAEKKVKYQSNVHWVPFMDLSINRALETVLKRLDITKAYIKSTDKIEGRNAILFYAYRPSRGSNWWTGSNVKQKYLLYELSNNDQHPTPRKLTIR